MVISQFLVSSVLKPLLAGFTHTQKAPVEFCRSYQANFIRSTNHDSFCDFCGALKLEKVGPIFNPCPSIPCNA